MTTRSFLKSLALLSSAAAGCPGIFIPKFEPVRWKHLLPMTADLAQHGDMSVPYWVVFDADTQRLVYHATRIEAENYAAKKGWIKSANMIHELGRRYEPA